MSVPSSSAVDLVVCSKAASYSCCRRCCCRVEAEGILVCTASDRQVRKQPSGTFW